MVVGVGENGEEAKQAGENTKGGSVRAVHEVQYSNRWGGGQGRGQGTAGAAQSPLGTVNKSDHPGGRWLKEKRAKQGGAQSGVVSVGGDSDKPRG
jgi:hypothetical protein